MPTPDPSPSNSYFPTPYSPTPFFSNPYSPTSSVISDTTNSYLPTPATSDNTSSTTTDPTTTAGYVEPKITAFSNNIPETSEVYVPQYSRKAQRKLLLLYDSIYFDLVNGCIVQVVGLSCSSAIASGYTCPDNTGVTITSINVVARDGSNTRSYVFQQNNTTAYADESLITEISSVYRDYVHIATNSDGSMYQVICTCADVYTFLKIIYIPVSKTTNTLIGTFLLGVDDDSVPSLISNKMFFSPISSNNIVKSNDDNLNSKTYNFNILNTSKTVFQLVPTVLYDWNNRYIFIYENNGYSPYSTVGNKIESNMLIDLPSSERTLIAYYTWMKVDANNNIILISVYANITHITILTYNQVIHTYDIYSTELFDETGPIFQ
jgi:hypothetical protein